MVYQQCGPICPQSCDSSDDTCHSGCAEGCMCPDGLVVGVNGQCVNGSLSCLSKCSLYKDACI